MADKQALVTEAKQFISDLSQNASKIDRLKKELVFNEEPVTAVFLGHMTDIFHAIIRRGLGNSQDFMDRLSQEKPRIVALKVFSEQLDNKLTKAAEVQTKAEEAMKRFISIDKDDKWAALSRTDLLELRKLFRKDLRITKFRELNLDELAREWETAAVYEKMQDCNANLTALKNDIAREAEM